MKRPVLRTQNGIDTLNAYLEETRAYMNKLEADNAALAEALEGLMNDISINHAIHNGNMIGGSTREALNQANEAIKQAKGDV